MTTLAVYSNKGGVGKTATAVNLAYLSALSGRATLLCDLDPQGAATFYLRVQPKLRKQARGLVKGRKAVERSIKGSDFEGLDLLPADFSHRNLDIAFDQRKRRKHRLDLVLKSLRSEYDLVVLDCPPTINILAENIFNASDILLIPLPPTTLSVHSHEQLSDFLNEVRGGRDRTATFLSMVDRRKKMHRELVAGLPASIDDLLNSMIPFSSQVEQMGVYREPVPEFAPRSRAARAYRDLWHEVEGKLLTSG
ncbi:MAG: ParA family protein [Caldilineaceae bacterium]